MATEQLHERWIVHVPRGGRRDFDERHVFADRPSAMAYAQAMKRIGEARVVREVHHVVR